MSPRAAFTAIGLFRYLGPRIAPAIEARFYGKKNLCVLASRIAIDVCEYFQVPVEPLPVRAVVYNAAFAAHVIDSFADIGDVMDWIHVDGSYSVAIGFRNGPVERHLWNGHLIVTGEGCFGDFSIRQAERPERNIVTGPAIIGAYDGEPMWRFTNAHGAYLEYEHIEDRSYVRAPDWRDAARRRPIVGKLIRELKEIERGRRQAIYRDISDAQPLAR